MVARRTLAHRRFTLLIFDLQSNRVSENSEVFAWRLVILWYGHTSTPGLWRYGVKKSYGLQKCRQLIVSTLPFMVDAVAEVVTAEVVTAEVVTAEVVTAEGGVGDMAFRARSTQVSMGKPSSTSWTKEASMTRPSSPSCSMQTTWGEAS